MPLRELFECVADAQSSSQTFAKRRSLHSHGVRDSNRLDRDCRGAACRHILAFASGNGQAGSPIASAACRRSGKIKYEEKVEIVVLANDCEAEVALIRDHS